MCRALKGSTALQSALQLYSSNSAPHSTPSTKRRGGSKHPESGRAAARSRPPLTSELACAHGRRCEEEAPFTPCASSRAVCTDPNIGDAPPRRFRDSSETRWRAAARDVRDSSGGAPRPGRAVLPAVHGEVLWSGEARQRDALMSHVSNRSQGMRGPEREGDPGRDRQGARRANDASVDWPPLTAHVVTSAAGQVARRSSRLPALPCRLPRRGRERFYTLAEPSFPSH